MLKKKISELDETNYLNDTDYFLVTRLNISSDGNQLTQNLSKRVSYNCIKDYMNLSSLAFKDKVLSSDISGKLPTDIINGLGSLAFKDKVLSSDISGNLPVNIIKGLSSLAFKNEISIDIIKGLSSLAFKDKVLSSDISGKLPTDIINGLGSLAFKDKITENDIAGTIEINKISGLINLLILKANISDIKLSSNYFNNKPTIPVATLSVGNTQIGTISIPNSTNVNVKTDYTNGIKIANIEIDGEKTDLYIPENTSKDISYAAFPDWNPDKTYNLTTGTTLSCNGFIRFWSDTAGNNNSFTRYAYINGITVARFLQWKADSTDSFDVLPVVIQASKDDVITFSSGVIAVFIPLKAYQIDLSTVVVPSNCVSYVIESGRFNSSDGTTHSNNSENDSWYRLYSDGWCELGGYILNLTFNLSTCSISLIKTYNNTNYAILHSIDRTNTGVNMSVCYTTNKTTNSFEILKDNASVGAAVLVGNISWEAKGFILK